MCLAMRQFRKECIREGEKKGRMEGEEAAVQKVIQAARRENLPEAIIQRLVSGVSGNPSGQNFSPA